MFVNFTTRYTVEHALLSNPVYRGAVKSLARPGRKQTNVSVRMA